MQAHLSICAGLPEPLLLDAISTQILVQLMLTQVLITQCTSGCLESAEMHVPLTFPTLISENYNACQRYGNTCLSTREILFIES